MATSDKPGKVAFNFNTYKGENREEPFYGQFGKERIRFLSPGDCDVFEFAEAMTRAETDKFQGAIALITTITPRDKRDLVLFGEGGLSVDMATGFVEAYKKHFEVTLSAGESDAS